MTLSDVLFVCSLLLLKNFTFLSVSFSGKVTVLRSLTKSQGYSLDVYYVCVLSMCIIDVYYVSSLKAFMSQVFATFSMFSLPIVGN